MSIPVAVHLNRSLWKQRKWTLDEHRAIQNILTPDPNHNFQCATMMTKKPEWIFSSVRAEIGNWVAWIETISAQLTIHSNLTKPFHFTSYQYNITTAGNSYPRINDRSWKSFHCALQELPGRPINSSTESSNFELKSKSSPVCPPVLN